MEPEKSLNSVELTRYRAAERQHQEVQDGNAQQVAEMVVDASVCDTAAEASFMVKEQEHESNGTPCPVLSPVRPVHVNREGDAAGNGNIEGPSAFLGDESMLTNQDGRQYQIADVVHGFVTLSKHCMEIVDTLEFQRLRKIHQLGVSDLVFPGATHTRFEHCLGVSHLAKIMAENLLRSQGSQGSQELSQMQRHWVELVQLAGLCHDLGHGPFSHIFEECVRGTGWNHEEMSCTIFETIVKNYNLTWCSEADRAFIKQAIKGRTEEQKPVEMKEPEEILVLLTPPAWLLDIVANKVNNVDVDKFDYIARDAHHTGIPACQYMRLITTARVKNDHICWPDKEAFEIYELFHARYALHKTVYSHRVRKAAECMLRDIFTGIENITPFTDPATFISLHDYNIFDKIIALLDQQKAPQTDKVRNVITKLLSHKLYKCVAEFVEQDSAVSCISIYCCFTFHHRKPMK
eukprot:TRINITY_DN2860_c0_g1_i3.p1 TRINITY_DN2860_c0_g1~~TRINITY_DN2860_c0_g1_i3.p1  ORF type:complete len:462 (-),score=81.92 TRINITY_DN2860_c0_g1_i3:462-1847(-)